MNWLKQWWSVFLLALLVGIIYFLPNIPPLLRGELPALNFEEVFSYGVKVREVMDGHFMDSDPYLAEYKEGFQTWDYYPLSLVIGLLARAIKVNTPEPIFIFADLLLPPITFLITFLLIFQISKSKSWSMLGAFIFVSFTNISTYKNIFTFQTRDPFAWLGQGFNYDASRFFVPALTMIFFSAFLFTFYRLAQSGVWNTKRIIISGIVYGLLFYVYFYYWVFATIAFGILFALFLIEKKTIDAFRIFVAGFIGFLISIPHWLRYVNFFHNPFSAEYMQRVGLAHGRFLRLESLDLMLAVAALLAVLWILRVQIGATTSRFLAVLLCTMIAVLNIQIILGFNPQPDHWGSRVNSYIFVFSIISIIFFLLQNLHISISRESKLASFLLIGLLIISFGVQAKDRMIQTVGYTVDRNMRDAFDWIDENTPPDSVFVTPAKKTRILLPFFTHTNSYLPMSCLSRAGENEIVDRYMEVYSLFGVPRDLVRASFLDSSTYHKSNSLYEKEIYLAEIESNWSIFCERYDLKYKNGGPDGGEEKYKGLSEDMVQNMLERYDRGAKGDVRLLRFKADYLFVGPAERLISTVDFEKIPYVERIYSNNTISIYKIINYAES